MEHEGATRLPPIGIDASAAQSEAVAKAETIRRWHLLMRAASLSVKRAPTADHGPAMSN